MADNGNNKATEIVTKQCPFLNAPCIKEKCAIYSELVQNRGGMAQKLGTCGVNAVVLILSEINQKTLIPQQKFQLPALRG